MTDRNTVFRKLVVALVLAASIAAISWTHERAVSSALESRLEVDRDGAGILADARTIVVTSSCRDEATRARMQRAWSTMLSSMSGREVDVLTADEVDERDLRDGPVILVGSPATNPFVAYAIDRLPVFVGERTLRLIDGSTRLGIPQSSFYGAPDYTSIAVRIANPYAPEHEAIVFTAPRDGTLIDHRFGLDFDGDYLVRVRDIVMREGRFEGAERPYTPDETTDFNRFDDDRGRYESSLILRKIRRKAPRNANTEDAIYQIRVPSDFPGSTALLEAFEQRAEVLRFATAEAAPGKMEPRLKVYVYPDLETKAAETGDFTYAHGSSSGEQVHTLYDERFRALDIAPEMTIARDDLFPGIETRAVREGWPVAMADYWRGRKLAHWATWLLDRDLLPSVGALLDNDRYARMSPLLRLPAAASFCQFVKFEFDPDDDAAEDGDETPSGMQRIIGLGFYPDAVPRILGKSEKEVTAHWRGWIRAQRASTTPPTAGPRTDFSTGRRPASRLAGVTIAHSYRLETGAASREFDDSLAALQNATSARWISIRPATAFDPETNTIDEFATRLDRFANGLPDGAILEAAATAKRRGLKVFLAPELHLDTLPFEDDRGSLDAFFDEYRRFVMHYAMLAEIAEVDLFSLGVGLGPAIAARSRDWESLAYDVRRIYSGPTVYCAGDEEELRTIRFGLAVDALGLDLELPPVPRGQTAESFYTRYLGGVASRAEAITERQRRPLILTAAGPGSASAILLDDRDFAIALRALATAFGAREWFGGVFADRWHTDRSRNDESTLGVPPLGPLARSALSDVFARFR